MLKTLSKLFTSHLVVLDENLRVVAASHIFYRQFPLIREGATILRVIYLIRPSCLLPLAIIMCLVLQNGCNRQESEFEGPAKSISIGVVTWPASAGLYVAAEKGFFEQNGIRAELKPYLSGHLVLNDLISGKIDFATATETPLAKAVLAGYDLSVVATLAYIKSPIIIIGHKDRNIASVTDLVGKRIGVTSGTAAEYFLHLFLTTSYIDPKQVSFMVLPADSLVDALVEKKVDAICAWIPLSFDALDMLGSDAIIFEEPDLYTMTWNLITTRELPMRDPELVKRVLKAVIRANTHIEKNSAEAMTIVDQKISPNPLPLKKAWHQFKFTVELNNKLLFELEEQVRWFDERDGGKRLRTNFLDYFHVSSLSAIDHDAVDIIKRVEQAKEP